MKVEIIRSQKRGYRFWEKVKPEQFGVYEPTRPLIVISTASERQMFLGFGGAFTEAAAYTFANTKEENKQQIMDAYFDSTVGLDYTLGRVSIHSCDFSLESYTYITEGDETLETFNMEHEEKWVIPMIKRAQTYREEPLKLLASPWSPPAFMKTTNEMTYGGELKAEYASLWAAYYVRFIEEMKRYDIPIWSVSTQNEPAAVQCWESCTYSAEQERDFIKHHLGPAIAQSQFPDTNIIIWDHNRDVLLERAMPILSDPEASQYVWGTGNHWYLSEDFNQLAVLHHAFPDKHLIFTEGCVELTTVAENATGEHHIGSWENGQRYGRNIIGDFNNWSEGWIDWNLLLNEQGGPNHVENYCEAPIMVDRATDTVLFNPSYYVIGHFSKYIKPGAKNILVTQSVGESIFATAFKNQDGTIVCVIQNEGWIEEVALLIDGVGMNITVPDQSIMTCVFTA